MTLYDDYSTKSPRPLQACLQVGGGLYGAPHMEHEVEFVLQCIPITMVKTAIDDDCPKFRMVTTIELAIPRFS